MLEKIRGTKYPQTANSGLTAEEKLELMSRNSQLGNIRLRAIKAGIEFNIHHEDIDWVSHCPILGIELVRGDADGRNNSPSIDRIDNTIGYVKGNVRVISQLANVMKNSATRGQLESFCANIFRYLDGEI